MGTTILPGGVLPVPVEIVYLTECQGLGMDHLLVYKSELHLNVLAPRSINAVMTFHILWRRAGH